LDPNIILYAPTVEDTEKLVLTVFDFDGLENQMEGKFRPGHFDGVNIVNAFELLNPTNAYFMKRIFNNYKL
jgi:pantoate--beta-alanine ligase